jgi:hypothetical protein
MAFNIKSTLEAVESHISRSGYVADVQIGEPVAPPDATDRIHAAIYMATAGVAELTLSSTIELHVATIRLYKRAAFTEGDDAGEVEMDMAMAVSEISSNLIGEYDLGATIRNIDVAGQYGQAVTAQWGYVALNQTMYRTVDITLPLVVDGSAEQAA